MLLRFLQGLVQFRNLNVTLWIIAIVVALFMAGIVIGKFASSIFIGLKSVLVVLGILVVSAWISISTFALFSQHIWIGAIVLVLDLFIMARICFSEFFPVLPFSKLFMAFKGPYESVICLIITLVFSMGFSFVGFLIAK